MLPSLINKQIPIEVLDLDVNVNCYINVVLDKWRQDLSSLFNCSLIDNDYRDIHCSDTPAPARWE